MSKDNKTIPQHLGIIMDGNRRWAKERNLPSLTGHQRGYEKTKLAADWAFSRGIKIVSFFAFSTENWKRATEEVNYLMKLLKHAVKEFEKLAEEKNYRILISGRIDELPGDLPEDCRNTMAASKDNSGGTVNICLNYGGRAEIIDAIKKMMKNNIELDQVHEGMIKKYLYHGEIGDPDIIMRTSGEQRLSGFMLWESSYSELMFIKKHWPDIEETDIDIIIEEYGKRNRRFGGE